MKQIYKIKPVELIYLVLYALYAFSSNLSASLLDFSAPQRIINYLCVFGLLFLYLTQEKIKAKECLFTIIIVLISVLAAYISDKTSLLVLACFIVCAKNTSFDKIVKISLIISFISMIVVISLCKIGIIPDYTYIRWGKVLHSYGFMYYTEILFIILFISIEYLYLRKKIASWIELIILISIFYYIYIETNQRLVSISAFFCIFLYILIIKLKILNITSKIVCSVTKSTAWICAFISIFLSYFYTPNNSLMKLINSLITNRLYCAHLAFIRYPIKLFGQNVVMYGNSAVTYRGASEYFFIDSGYVYSLISNGIMLTIVILLIYSFMYQRACYHNNKMLFIWITVTLLFAMINDCWILLRYNPIILALPTLFENKIEMKYITKRFKFCFTIKGESIFN